MSKFHVHSNGEKIFDLRTAVEVALRKGMTSTSAPAQATVELGSPTWDHSSACSWSKGQEGDIFTAACNPSGDDHAFELFSPIVDLEHEDNLSEVWSVRISLGISDRPYLFISFGSADEGVNFELDDRQKNRFKMAAESGTEVKSIAAQVALIEDILTWFDMEWSEVSSETFCNVKRHVLGISEKDLFWEEPGSAGYGPDHRRVRVYDTGMHTLMVCLEAKQAPEKGEIPYGYISRREFAEIVHTLTDYRRMTNGFLEAAGMESRV